MRLLVLTGLYPDPQNPVHGVFVARFLEALAEHTGWRSTVIAPRAVPFPFLGRLLPPPWPGRRLPPLQVERGGEVRHHPRYPHLRGCGLALAARAVARAAAPAAAEILRRERHDALLGIYLYPYGAAAARLADRFGLPLLLSARGSDALVLGRLPLVGRQIGRALGSARLVHVVSGELAAAVASLGGVPPARIAVIGNGVDTRLFHPGPRPGLRRSWGVPQTSTLVLLVGRLVPAKGQDLAIRALPQVGATTHLVLVGEGPDRARLDRLAARLGVAARVHFLGTLAPPALAQAYREADLFLLPSHREGCPNALLEAVASGLPCVASPVGEAPAILAEGRLGVLIRGEGPGALALALAAAFAHRPDPELRKSKLAECSWPMAAERFAAAAGRALGWSP